MPAEYGKPSPKGAEITAPPKDPPTTTPIDIEAEYTRIQEGVLTAMARAKRQAPVNPTTSQNEVPMINAYNVLVLGRAAEGEITHIAGKIPDVGPLSQFAVAFQRVARAIRPLGSGIAEVPQGTRTLYMVTSLRTAKGGRIRDDVPTKEEQKTRLALKATVLPSAVALLKAMQHDLSTITKVNGDLVTVRHLFPDAKEQHEFLLEALTRSVDDLFDPSKPKNGREADLLRRLRGKTAEEFKAELRKHFSEHNRRKDEKERKSHKTK